MALTNLIDQMGTKPMTSQEAGDLCRDLSYTADKKYAAYQWTDPTHAAYSSYSFKLKLPDVKWPKCTGEYIGKDGPWHHFHADEWAFHTGKMPKHLKCCLCGLEWYAEDAAKLRNLTVLLYCLNAKLLEDELGF